jgi:hypothetical protein
MLPVPWNAIHGACFALEYLATLTVRMQGDGQIAGRPTWAHSRGGRR